MKKKVSILFLAIVAIAISVPVGFALSLDSASLLNASSTVARAQAWPSGISDAARLVVLGGCLFGLAAALRKSRVHE